MSDEDDLDKLLDEVERKFCSKVSVAASGRCSSEARKCGKEDTGKTKHRCKHSSRSSAQPDQLDTSDTEDIDAFLEDLLEDNDGGDHLQPKTEQCPTGAPVERRPLPPSGGRRCCPVFLGGSAISCGVGTAASQRSCDQLRCTTCDFWVLMFDDCEWDLSCDYLFLRNNMPDRQKLRGRLRNSSGCRAYACQCSWVSTSEASDLRDRPKLTWVCGKHHE